MAARRCGVAAEEAVFASLVILARASAWIFVCLGGLGGSGDGVGGPAATISSRPKSSSKKTDLISILNFVMFF